MPRDPASQRPFQDLLQQHRRIVFKVANAYAWTREDREDLAQEIATQLWRAFPSYDPVRPFSTWMYRIGLNVAVSFQRNDGLRRRHVASLGDALPDIEDPHAADPEADDAIRLLNRCIQRLEPINRALMLLYLDDCGHREIGEILGISETNVATRINRLKQRIRAELAGPKENDDAR